MNRSRRTEILIKGSEAVAKRLCEEIEGKYEVNTVDEPNYGLVMIKMREEAQKSLFYLGEVFVTEAKVQIYGSIGIGLVIGNKLELSYWLSVIDAAYNAGLEEVKGWERVFIEEEKRINERIKMEQAKVLMTKVSFDTMDS
ncbi:MAG: phosphonate C-P lyase system protein PhnG [Bacillota bacterium]|nr:phosphonate C-P lyase system protein PhnG [Bacillota bacterium]